MPHKIVWPQSCQHLYRFICELSYKNKILKLIRIAQLVQFDMTPEYAVNRLRLCNLHGADHNYETAL